MHRRRMLTTALALVAMAAIMTTPVAEAEPGPEPPELDVSIKVNLLAAEVGGTLHLGWSAEEVGAMFVAGQASASLETSPAAHRCGIVDADQYDSLEQTSTFERLLKQTEAADAASFDPDAGVEATCEITEDFTLPWARVDVLDVGGNVYSALVTRDGLAEGRVLNWAEMTLTERAVLPTDEPDLALDNIGGEQLRGYVDTPDGITDIAYSVTRDGWAIAQGDMVLGTGEEMEAFRKEIDEGLFFKSNNRPQAGYQWPNGEVWYEMHDDILNDSAYTSLTPPMRQRIEDAVDAWNQTPTNISIRQCPSSVPGGPPNCVNTGHYLRIVPQTDDPDRPGCQSRVGMVAGAFQRIWLKPACSTGSVQHEFGHTLGLYHEHQRRDRGTALHVDFGNILDHREPDFQIPNPSAPLGVHDIGSLMHYGSFSATEDPNPSSDRPTILQRNRLNRWDTSIRRWVEELNTSHTLDELAFGDFGRPGDPGNPDGEQDILTNNGGRWEASWGGNTAWEQINNSSLEMDQVQFGEFDGAPGTDVFAHFRDGFGDQRWHVRFSGVGNWQPLTSSSRGVDIVHVADFGSPPAPGSNEPGPADGLSDVFTVYGGHFRVSWFGTQPWMEINSSSRQFDQLAFGDFGSPPPPFSRVPGPEDGITDVLTRFSGRWRISWGGASSWYPTRGSGIDVDRLRVADIGSPPTGGGSGCQVPGPKDDIADVITTFGGRIQVSYGAITQWQCMRRMPASIKLFKLGDLIGDSAVEIFSDGIYSTQRTAPSIGDIDGINDLYP